MSEPIKTERYRLALIAHHAEKLAELAEDDSKLESTKEFTSVYDICTTFGVDPDLLKDLAKYMKKLAEKETK